jgi:hypothetical protein
VQQRREGEAAAAGQVERCGTAGGERRRRTAAQRKVGHPRRAHAAMVRPAEALRAARGAQQAREARARARRRSAVGSAWEEGEACAQQRVRQRVQQAARGGRFVRGRGHGAAAAVADGGARSGGVVW